MQDLKQHARFALANEYCGLASISMFTTFLISMREIVEHPAKLCTLLRRSISKVKMVPSGLLDDAVPGHKYLRF